MSEACLSPAFFCYMGMGENSYLNTGALTSLCLVSQFGVLRTHIAYGNPPSALSCNNNLMMAMSVALNFETCKHANIEQACDERRHMSNKMNRDASL